MVCVSNNVPLFHVDIIVYPFPNPNGGLACSANKTDPKTNSGSVDNIESHILQQIHFIYSLSFVLV